MNKNSVIDKFTDPSIFSLPKCILCSNLIGGHNEDILKCRAFPEGVPDEKLWESETSECANGIFFEK